MIVAWRAAITAVPGMPCACTWNGLAKSPARNAVAMSRMCRRMAAIPAVSEPSSRSRTMRPPSGKSSKTCAEVYWSTPMTAWPRACNATKASSERALPRHPSSAAAMTRATLKTRKRSRAFVLEGHLDLRAIALDLAILQLHIELRDLGHPQVAQRLRRPLDRRRSGFLPGFGARPDQLDDLVDGLGHVTLLM